MKAKIALLVALVWIYLTAALIFQTLLTIGYIEKMPPTPTSDELEENETGYFDSDISFKLDASQQFLQENLVEENGHINLYHTVEENQNWPGENQTNSEAMSYYLLWTAQDQQKESFDQALDYIQTYMIQPDIGYLMWRIEADGSVSGDGNNIASDADLRAIQALIIAEEQWGDERYTTLIDTLASGLERTAITEDNLLAPYGGASGNSTWTADEVWLSYTHFNVFKSLAERRGEPWQSVHENMKAAVLEAQLANGLYNSQLTASRAYGNGPDAGAYSINSLWIMVRNAESNDEQLRASAQKSLNFYKQHFAQDGVLYQSYDSSGEPVLAEQSPWVYALVARAAINLNDLQFSQKMVAELLKYQILEDELFGAIIEGDGREKRVGQFTMQESILTLQDFEKNSVSFFSHRLNNTIN